MTRAGAALLRFDLLPALCRWQLAPFAHQSLPLRRWHLLEALEALMQALALGRRHLAEFALIGARLLALFRRHLLPVCDPLADFFASRRWQGDPVFGFLQHVRLPARRQLIPLLPQRCQHFALGWIQARPGACCRRWRFGACRRWH